MNIEEKTIITEFVVEARKRVKAMEADIGKLVKNEHAQDFNLLYHLYRTVHDLGGAFAFLGYTPLEALCDILKSLILDIKEKKIEADDEIVARMKEGVSKLRSLIDVINQGKELGLREARISALGTFLNGPVPLLERSDLDSEQPENYPFYCNICNHKVKSWGPGKTRACPFCKSFGRQRLVWFFMSNSLGIGNGKPCRILHWAPEKCIGDRLKEIPEVQYFSADLNFEASIAADICKTPIQDNSLDGVIANHVLEHIPDDHKAMAEIFRVLKPGAWAILQVPILSLDETYEDPATNDTEENRIKYYGHPWHFRKYGQKDYIRRLENTGFEFFLESDFSIDRQVHGIQKFDAINLSRKPL